MRFELLDFRASLRGTSRVVEALRLLKVLAQLFNATAIIRPRRCIENLTCPAGTIHFRTTGQDQRMNLALGVLQQLGDVAESPRVPKPEKLVTVADGPKVLLLAKQRHHRSLTE